jgi:hypothetical protein
MRSATRELNEREAKPSPHLPALYQVKSLLQWLVRIFFACSVAFEVPIRDLWTGPILARAAVFLLCALGKLATGAFARPYTHREVRTHIQIVPESAASSASGETTA